MLFLKSFENISCLRRFYGGHDLSPFTKHLFVQLSGRISDYFLNISGTESVSTVFGKQFVPLQTQKNNLFDLLIFN